VEIQVYLHFNFTKLLAELKDKLLDNFRKTCTKFTLSLFSLKKYKGGFAAIS